MATRPGEVDRTCAGDRSAEARAIRARDSLEQRSRPWSDLSPNVTGDLAAGKPLVVYVLIPLCANSQIDCGNSAAGRPDDLERNLYWGAVFGARRFFDGYRSPFKRVEVRSHQAGYLQRVVYRRMLRGAHWQQPDDAEQLVILEAWHGERIDQTVGRFWEVATRGGCIEFQDGEHPRQERIHVVGFAGHNRLMDGLRLADPPPAAEATPIPSFVLACASEPYFGPALRRAGARPLLTTRELMAPEGYLVRAVAIALGDNSSPQALRNAAVSAQLAWHKQLRPAQARWIFAPLLL